MTVREGHEITALIVRWIEQQRAALVPWQRIANELGSRGGGKVTKEQLIAMTLRRPRAYAGKKTETLFANAFYDGSLDKMIADAKAYWASSPDVRTSFDDDNKAKDLPLENADTLRTIAYALEVERLRKGAVDRVMAMVLRSSTPISPADLLDIFRLEHKRILIEESMSTPPTDDASTDR